MRFVNSLSKNNMENARNFMDAMAKFIICSYTARESCSFNKITLELPLKIMYYKFY